MRQYRGLTEDGKWVYGWYAKIEENHFIIPDTASLCFGVQIVTKHDFIEGFVKVIPETVGQFTGLKDKNGKGDETYTNDVVSSYNDVKYLIYWDSEYGQWWGHIINETKDTYTKPLCEILDNNYMHIIGDIHTTPDLLESSND